MNQIIPRQRQSPYAILVLTSRLLQSLVKQAGFIIIIILFGGKRSQDKGADAIFITIGLVVLSIIRGLIAYFRSYYSVQDDQFIVEKGLLRTSKVTIPLDRIQAVDFDQTPVHKLVNLVKVNITTAGSDGSEANIEAITLDKATALREVLLSQVTSNNQEHSSVGLAELSSIDQEPIITLSFLDILKVGFVENHINSALIIFAFLASLFGQIQDVGLLDKLRQYIPDASALAADITAIGAVVVVIAILSILISLVKTALLYFNLKLLRQQDSFRLSHGLLNTRQFTAKDSKIQVLGWEQTWLQSAFNYSTMFFKQASSRSVSAKKRLSIPGCREQHIQAVAEDLDYQDSFPDASWSSPSKYYVRYHFRNLIVFVTILLALASVSPFVVYISIGVIVFGLYRSIGIIKRQRKLSYKIDEDHIQLKGGTFGHRYDMAKSYKVQAVSVAASLYQRRRGLANLVVSTAAGDIKIPILVRSRADKLRDQLLYSAEVSHQPWM